MEITPLTAARPVPAPTPVTDGAASADEGARRDLAARAGQEPKAVSEQRQVDENCGLPLGELRELSARVGLEVRIQPVPDSNVTFVRLFEPETGEVLAELRAQTEARLDQKA